MGLFDNGASRGEVAARMASPGRGPSRCTRHRKVPRHTLGEARWPSRVAMVARGGTRVVREAAMAHLAHLATILG